MGPSAALWGMPPSVALTVIDLRTPRMHRPQRRWLGLLCGVGLGLAQAAQPPNEPEPAPPRELVWSLGLRLKMDDLRQPGQLGLRPMIGLRYGRWRTGVVDGENWHRFGQVKSDNTLTYDLSAQSAWRTAL